MWSRSLLTNPCYQSHTNSTYPSQSSPVNAITIQHQHYRVEYPYQGSDINKIYDWYHYYQKRLVELQEHPHKFQLNDRVPIMDNWTAKNKDDNQKLWNMCLKEIHTVKEWIKYYETAIHHAGFRTASSRQCSSNQSQQQSNNCMHRNHNIDRRSRSRSRSRERTDTEKNKTSSNELPSGRGQHTSYVRDYVDDNAPTTHWHPSNTTEKQIFPSYHQSQHAQSHHHQHLIQSNDIPARLPTTQINDTPATQSPGQTQPQSIGHAASTSTTTTTETATETTTTTHTPFNTDPSESSLWEVHDDDTDDIVAIKIKLSNKVKLNLAGVSKHILNIKNKIVEPPFPKFKLLISREDETGSNDILDDALRHALLKMNKQDNDELNLILKMIKQQTINKQDPADGNWNNVIVVVENSNQPCSFQAPKKITKKTLFYYLRKYEGVKLKLRHRDLIKRQ